jgi:acetolactate synthase-1/2/3 large subunit
MKNNAQILAQTLERHGIRYVFGYPGGQNARFIEALSETAVEFVLVTHEGSAGFMADAYGRLTGRPGVCLSTLGPGATNLATGVGNAFLDRNPVLAITAQMGRAWKGRTVQMHVDHRPLFAPITKWSAELVGGRIRKTVERALEIALAERPGPVHLDLPEDVADETETEREVNADEGNRDEQDRRNVEEHHSTTTTHHSRPKTQYLPPMSFSRWAMDLIRQARRPLVAIGLTMNRAGATAELRRFVERHRLPVVCTLMAKGQAPEDGAHFVGVLGRARRDLVMDFCRPADLVIAIGYDPVEFNYEEWLPKTTPLIHIDTSPADISPDYAVPCQMVGDIRQALAALDALPTLAHEWDLSALPGHRRRLFVALTPPSKGFAPHQALLTMRDLLPDDGLLVSDVGAHTHLIGQLWDTRGAGNFLVSNGWSSMGYAIPAAIAAKLIHPERSVVACMGDGGYLMMVGEINTAVRLRLPVVFVVLRDNYLSLIRVKQHRKQFAERGVRLFNETYRSSNTLFGAEVVTVHDAEAFRQAFAKAVHGDAPVVIEAVVDPAEYDAVV